MRLAQFLILGVGFGLLLLEHKSEDLFGTTSLKALFGILVAILLVVTLPVGKKWFAQSTSFYQVVDNETLEGLYWIKNNTSPNDVIAASPWEPHLVGWWIEGVSKRPCIYASDIQWLSFSAEKENAIVANKLFQKNIKIADTLELIQENKIKYLFIDKKNIIPTSQIISSEYFMPVFENSRVLILQFRH